MDNVFDAGKEHLRKQAEALLADTSRPVEDLPPEKVRELIHDYQVHQIELERQNEELRSAQGALEENRERYFDLYDLAPVGYLVRAGADPVQAVYRATRRGNLGGKRAGQGNDGVFHPACEIDQDAFNR